MPKPKITFRRVSHDKYHVSGYWHGGTHHLAIYVNGKFHDAFIEQVFAKTSERSRLPTQRGIHATRRGWMIRGLNTSLQMPMPDGRSRYIAFPLYEAKALVKHCIENNIKPKRLSLAKIAKLAKHCREMELMTIRTKKKEISCPYNSR